MARWSEQDSCKFVSLYRDAECLWNVFDSSYKNREKRLEAFRMIVTEMNLPWLTLNDVGKKIRSLRSTYMQELSKIKKSLKSGAGTDYVYSPRVKWFNEMDFVMKNSNVSVKPTSSNMESEDEANLPINLVEENIEILEGEPLPPPTNLNRRPKKRSRLQNITAAVKELSEMNKTLSAPLTYKEDECDIIGRHVAMQLRRLSPNGIIDANLEIQQVLAKYRKQEMHDSSASSQANNEAIYYVQAEQNFGELK